MTSLLPAILLLAPSAPPAAPLPGADAPPVVLPAQPAAPAGAQKIDFNRDVRPILADHCFQCHGPDAGKRKADLRLDVDPGERKRDTIIVAPGKPDESELIRRISADDARDRMPPAKFARPLSPKQIETLKA